METKDSTSNKPETLSASQTNKTFHSLLRRTGANDKPEKTYLFPRGECPSPKNLPEAKSHIVDFQVQENPRIIAARKVKYIQDNVVLNDTEKDLKPISHFQKRRFNKTETNTSSQYSDEAKSNLQKNTNLSRRVRDNYTRNPINLMSQTQLHDYNTEQRGKMVIHTKAVTEYLSSKGVQKSFISPTAPPSQSNGTRKNTANINTVPASLLKSAIEQKKQEPNFAKRGFKSYLTGNKNQVSFV